jgi:glutaredoxin-like protein
MVSESLLHPSILTIYGTKWCRDCHRTRLFLDQHKVTYRWIDLDEEPASAEWVKQINHGCSSVPTLIFPDGSTLTEPDDNQLKSKLNL